MISLAHVTKSYHGGNTVLHQVDLQVGKGDFLYVVGGSGAGKSSLLRIISTEDTPESGKVSLFGYDLREISASTLRAIRRTIGYIPQDIRLIPDMSVFENIAISMHLAGSRVLNRASRRRVQELIELMDLGSKKDSAASTLSGGEAQRVAIARALVRSPEILIADEPTGAQDRNQTWKIMHHFVRANSLNSTILIATHDREIVRRVPKKCAVIQSGRLSLEDAGQCLY